MTNLGNDADRIRAAIGDIQQAGRELYLVAERMGPCHLSSTLLQHRRWLEIVEGALTAVLAKLEDKDPTPEEYSEAWQAAQEAGQLVIKFVDPNPPPCPDCGGGDGLACRCATGEEW